MRINKNTTVEKLERSASGKSDGYGQPLYEVVASGFRVRLVRSQRTLVTTSGDVVRIDATMTSDIRVLTGDRLVISDDELYTVLDVSEPVDVLGRAAMFNSSLVRRRRIAVEG